MFIPSTTITARTHDVGLPEFLFSVGPASKPIAGEVAGHSPKCQTDIPSTQPIAVLMLTNHLRRLLNTTPTLGLVYI